MDERGKRRSARILALGEQKNEKAKKIVSADFVKTTDAEQSSERKQSKKKKVKQVYEEGQNPTAVSPLSKGSTSKNLQASENSIEGIIGFILDMLEVKDEYRYFSKPHNVQKYDHTGSLNKPEDFATLRQKHRSGMYSTLQQFENDVYAVFGKAMDSNSPYSISYKQALSLQEQAMQIFHSFQYKPISSELERMAWHQKYFHHIEGVSRRNGKVQTLTSIPQIKCSFPPEIPSEMRQSFSWNNNPNLGRRISSRSTGRKGDENYSGVT